MAQEVPIGLKALILRLKIYGAHRVSHALNEPRGLHEPAPHRVLQGPDEPSKSGGRVHYIPPSGSTA